MIGVGKWRWPIILGLSLATGAALVLSGVVRLKYEARAFLSYSGNADQIDEELKMFRSSPAVEATIEQVVSQPLEIALRTQSDTPSGVVSKLESAAHACVEQSLMKHRKVLQDLRDRFQKQVVNLEARLTGFTEDRKVLLAGPRRNTPRAQLVAKIEALKTRRRLLIEGYPSHTDIPVLAQRIQELLNQLDRPSGPKATQITNLDRQINETNLRREYFLRRLNETEKDQLALKPLWTALLPIQKPTWPQQAERWPLGAGTCVGVFVLSVIFFRTERRRVTDVQDSASDVLRPTPEIDETTPDVERRTSDEAVALEVVSPELPMDPLTEKAAELYRKWVDVANTLYSPAPEPPQGLLDLVGPLLQESSDFLPEGHDVLARYLARVATSGDLASHVARTVLMTLTGAEEAGVSPEHRLAMALAALFHDLAVVPRPEAAQEDVGSEVGRLSASVLARIPGLTPALLSMVEDILVGMDEFKLETWQNVAHGMALEPLSKVLREIDRFEKLMQKQKARLDRRIANQ